MALLNLGWHCIGYGVEILAADLKHGVSHPVPLQVVQPHNK